MEVSRLKEFIIENDKIVDILEDIGCHHISNKGNYITCGNPDGDNTTAITVYTDSPNLSVINYTRSLIDGNRTTDILDLVAYFKKMNFVEVIKYLCNLCGIDYYEKEEELVESLQILKLLSGMQQDSDGDEDPMLQPINEKILDYYLPYGNIMFEKDNISLSTQREWDIRYDPQSNHIVIPIRSEVGDLVGIKGRIFKEHLDEGENKYIYLHNCAKSKILFGLDKNLNNIIQQGRVFVVESEKSVMQLYEMGVYAVATGGANISKYQIDMITRIGVPIIFSYDKDISEEKLKQIADRFIEGVPIWALIDKNNILDEKQSPSDNKEKWDYMIKNNIYKIK